MVLNMCTAVQCRGIGPRSFRDQAPGLVPPGLLGALPLTTTPTMAANIPAQPDFAVIAQSLHTAGTELGKCPNIVGLQQNVEIIGLLRRLTEGVAGLTEGMARVETRLSALYVSKYT